MIENDATTARLLVTCPDKPGIISAVSTFLFKKVTGLKKVNISWMVTQLRMTFLRLKVLKSLRLTW